MRAFQHLNARSVEDAALTLESKNSMVNAGGTDLIGTLRNYVLPDSLYPEMVVNIKSIPGLDYIKEEGGMLKIGALTRVADIARDAAVAGKYPALAQAAASVASPHIRDMGTIGGNICQVNRCWYFRKPNNRFDCIRKGGSMCYAMAGDNRYHAIFGAVKACIAVNPSDIAPALVVFRAKIKTNKRLIEAEQFWDAAVPGSTVLAAGEVVTEIQLPTPADGTRSAFIKFAERKSIDFPVVNCAAAIGGGSAAICLNAVYNKPYRAAKAEAAIAGKTIDESAAEAAGKAAVEGAVKLGYNQWKIQIARTLVKRAVLACKP